MKINVSLKEIFIHYDRRSVDNYYPQLCAHIENGFLIGTYKDVVTVRKILEAYYDWSADKFQEIMARNDDMLFVNYIFAYHESSILLWLRTLRGENLYQQYAIGEDDLSLNRRILKLALEQCCGINYTKASKATFGLIKLYDEVIEDLLYVGTELFHAAQFLAELRMIPGSLQATIAQNGLFKITRKGEVEPVFEQIFFKMKDDFAKGIMDTESVKELVDEIKKCFGIDYNFACGQIVQIKKYHSPINWEFQTIEQGILVENLVRNGVSKENAENFYAGLTLNSKNKLTIKDAVYKVNNMERYFFRPILEIPQNGRKRQLIGIQKWGESITVLATNNFQWNKAPEEWKRNKCFQQYLEKKSDEHDALLEDEVEKILQANKIPFFRNITSFGEGSSAKSINVAGVGEIDFIWLDSIRNCIVVADCKYNRARYDMISFSADFSNFKNTYESKIGNKSKWVEDNKELVLNHFQRNFPELGIRINDFSVRELFIINTPTLYMYLSRVKTVCFFNLQEFIKKGYEHPDLVIKIKNGYKLSIKIKSYPYL